VSAQPTNAEEWSKEKRIEFVGVCVENVTLDPRVNESFTFTQIYNTCICIRNYFTATYSNDEMTAKGKNYGPQDHLEIVDVTHRCIDHLREIAEEYPKNLDELLPKPNNEI
jgi:hypothetical protein